MLKHEPEATTTLLIDHCCGRLPSIGQASQSNGAASNGVAANDSGADAAPPAAHASSPAYLNVFNSSLQLGRTAVEAAAAATAAVLPGGLSSTAAPVESGTNGSVPLTAKEKRKQTAAPMVAAESASSLAELASTSSQPAAPPPPSPRPFFAHFVNHPTEFLRFLEAVALERWNQKIDLSRSPAKAKSAAPPPPVYEETAGQAPPADDGDLSDQKAMWNTILELHLTFAQDGRTLARDRENHRQKALRLIEQVGAIPYDATHALILCSINAFTDGLVVLWEALGMYEDVLRFWMDKEKEIAALPAAAATTKEPSGRAAAAAAAIATPRRPSDEVMDQLRRYGPSHPYLYPLVLRFLTSSNGLLSRHQADLRYVLDVIDRDRIMPPLQVVQVLSRNDVASVGIVKEWLMQKVGGLRVEIESVSPSSGPARLVYMRDRLTPRSGLLLGSDAHRVVSDRDGRPAAGD